METSNVKIEKNILFYAQQNVGHGIHKVEEAISFLEEEMDKKFTIDEIVKILNIAFKNRSVTFEKFSSGGGFSNPRNRDFDPNGSAPSNSFFLKHTPGNEWVGSSVSGIKAKPVFKKIQVIHRDSGGLVWIRDYKDLPPNLSVSKKDMVKLRDITHNVRNVKNQLLVTTNGEGKDLIIVFHV